MDFILESLNSRQKEAVLATQGPVLIIAGAGSGKTKTLTHRLAYILKKGTKPENILALTFTNKAAGEMKNRIRDLLLKTDSGFQNFHLPYLGTFHAFGVKILRREISKLGFNQDFVIYDDDDSKALIKKTIEELNLDPKTWNPGAVLAKISSIKNELRGEKFFSELENQTSVFQKILGLIFKRYEEKLKENNALDFDDLLVKTVSLFQNFPATLAQYQKQFRYILIDEYQDTNSIQYALIRLLSQNHNNVCVVGDDAQAIYSFRGADFRNILNFEIDYPDAKVIFLDENYRSTQNILEAASGVIAKNVFQKPKNLWTSNQSGQPILISSAATEKSEARLVVEEIKYLMRENKLKPKDFAVLYRTNAQSRAQEEAFLAEKIPYRIIGGVKFWSRKEIKDALSYLKIIQNEADRISLLRIINTPPRGIGKKTQELIFQKGLIEAANLNSNVKSFFSLMEELKKESEALSLNSLIKLIMEKTGYFDYLKNEAELSHNDRRENIQELLGAAKNWGNEPAQKTLPEFLTHVSLFSSGDEMDEKNAVSLMTIHAAKGLEFPAVFIIGCEEGLLPWRDSLTNPAELEEERRLCYVGMTRAKERLHLIFTRSRTLYGLNSINSPSRFLADIPEHLVEFNEAEGVGQNEEIIIF
ncbi:MAG: UvrD-helicase domain-containing protein [Parcubacteria group bacterium]|nr:UvrD-helicase domain-containing protein [Parcubacteria group bacterium]